MKQVTKLTTDRGNLLFIGTANEEEIYQDTDKHDGWSLIGLRPNTEDELRERARDTDIEEFCTIPDFLKQYIDYDKFSEDMEEDWQERHDVKATRKNDDGDTLYLGFGLGTSARSYFSEHNITDYKSYCEYFDEIGLTKKQFDAFKKKYAN